MPDLPQVIVPEAMYASTLAVLLYLAAWQAILVAGSIASRVRARVTSRRR